MKWSDEGSTVGFIGIEGVGIIGMFCVADVVRSESKEVIETMSRDEIDVFMLTVFMLTSIARLLARDRLYIYGPISKWPLPFFTTLRVYFAPWLWHHITL